jgi:hypothetical protein
VSASQLKIFASVCAGYLPLPLWSIAVAYWRYKHDSGIRERFLIREQCMDTFFQC